MRVEKSVLENYSRPGRALRRLSLRSAFWAKWFAAATGLFEGWQRVFRGVAALEGSDSLIQAWVVNGCAVKGPSYWQGCFSWWVSCHTVVRFPFLGF